jgi:thymidylate synthase
MNIYESFEEAYRSELALTLKHGKSVAPRSLPTVERLGCHFRLLNPRSRLIASTARRWSVHYAIGEFLWHLGASADAAAIRYYAPMWRGYSDGSSVTGSCYGRTLFGNSSMGSASRWEAARELLRNDPATRRAIVALAPKDPVFTANDLDVACASSLQFFLREDRLNAVVYMRSNDQFLGLSYDVFLFTMLQELMALQLGVGLGWYEHIAASAHIYDRDVLRAQQICAEQSQAASPMDRMTSPSAVAVVLRYEQGIRTGATAGTLFDVPVYWSDLLRVLAFYKAKRLAERSTMDRLVDDLRASPFQTFLRRDAGALGVQGPSVLV